jgi:uncharacterized repeat protein (TIGR01451 family)
MGIDRGRATREVTSMLSRGALGLASSRTRRAFALSWSVLFILSLLLQYATFALAPAALAVHDEGLFELDGNAVSEVAKPGEDWDHVFAGTSAAITTPVFLTDKVNSLTDDIFTGGASKDINDTSDWLWTTSKPQAKNDITNAFAAAYTAKNADTAGDTIVYFGLNKYDASGDNFVGFWFLKGQVGPTGTGIASGSPFSGSHTVGDVLVLADYTNGGGISTFSVYQWVASGGDVATHLDTVATGVPCTAAPAADVACATTNTDTEQSPWPFTDKSGEHDFLAGELFEGGIDLTKLHLDTGCFTSFIAETRSSQAVTATLSDFAGGEFSFCVPPTIATQVKQDGQSLGSVGTISKGDSVTDTATLTGTKGTVTGTVDFFQCFNASAVPDCSTGGSKVPATKTLSGGAATSDPFTPGAVGFYCFRVEYTPATGSKYLAATHTNKTTECFQVLAATVTIGKTADDGSVSAGDQIGFTLTWGNSGPGKATGVVVTDPLPTDAGLDWSIAGSTGTGSTCQIAGAIGAEILTCNVGVIPGNTAVSGTVHVVSDTTLASCGSVDNTGSINSDNDGSANASASVVVGCPIIHAVKTVATGAGAFGPTSVATPGDVLHFKIVVSNTGNGTATNVPVSDNIAAVLAHATYNDDCSNSCNFAASTLTWTIPTIAAGGSVTLTFSVTLDSTFPTGTTHLPNVVVVTGPGSNCAAGSGDADCDTDTTVATSVLAIDKSFTGNTNGTDPDLHVPSAKVGDTLHYTLAYAGAGPLTNAVITDVLPQGLEYVAGTALGNADFNDGTYDPATRTITWHAKGTLPDPASGAVTYDAKVLATAPDFAQPLVNIATIDSDETAPDSDTAAVAVLAPPEALTPPPTDTLTAQTGTSNPGFALMLILLGVAAVTLSIGFVTPVPARMSRRDRRG